MDRICGNCALRTLKGGVCPIFNADMSGEKGCPYFASKLHTCEVCGSVIPKGGYIIDEHLVCGECANGSACRICAFNGTCRLEQDQTCSEPLYIPIQQRQGNMVIQTQITNPRRIQATCEAGCPCYRSEGKADGSFCWKKLGCGCHDRKINWRNV